MPNPGHSEKLVMLEEVVCEAIPGNWVPNAPKRTKPEPNEARLAQLEAMPDADLLALVQASPRNRSELLAIHDIATRRVATGSNGSAAEVSRAAMLAALGNPS